MKRAMTRAARAELANAIRGRYCAAAGKDKRKILHEFLAATGYREIGHPHPERPSGGQACADSSTYAALRRGRSRGPDHHVGGL